MNADPVLFWWESDLRLLAAGQWVDCGVGPDEDFFPALREALAEIEPGTPVRIVVHPHRLRTHLLEEVPGRLRRGWNGRAGWRRRLAGEFPELADPDTIWSTWPSPSGSGLVVSFEPSSRLPVLARELARAGWPVAGAWPLPLLLADRPAGGGRGGLSVLATGERTLVSWFSASGELGAEVHGGADLLEPTLAALRGALARFDEDEPATGWLAIEDGPAADALRHAAGGLGLHRTTLAELIGRARLLAPGGPADFLAPPAWWKRRAPRRQLAAAAGLLLAAAAAWQVRTVRLHRDQRRREWAERQADQQALREKTAAGLARQSQIDQVAGDVGRLESAPSLHYELLMALARAAADGVILESVTAQGADFSIAGRTEEAAGPGAGPLPAFYRALASPGAPWTLGGEPSGGAGARFSVTGRFHQPAPAGPPAAELSGSPASSLERWTSRLEAQRARLPTAASFDAQIKRRSPRWTVASESAEPVAGGQVRHYVLAYERPRLDDWSDLVEAIRDFCAQPGLTIDRLALTAGPEGADAFLQAGLSLSVRLRP